MTVTRVFPNHANGTTGKIMWQTAEFKAGPPGVRVFCPLSSAIMLDPYRTTPGSTIAISPDGTDQHAQILQPGDVAVFDKPVHSFYAWNAASNAMRLLPNALPITFPFGIGWCAFLAATSAAELRDRISHGARYPSGIFARGIIGDVSVGPPAMNGLVDGSGPFIVPNSRGIRITVACRTDAGLLMDAPADFALTLRPHYAIFTKKADSNVLWPQSLGLDDVLENDTFESVWTPASDSDIVFGKGRESVEIANLVPGGLCAFNAPVFAGALLGSIVWVGEAF